MRGGQPVSALHPDLESNPNKENARDDNQRADLAHGALRQAAQHFQHALQKRRGQRIGQPLQYHHQPEGQQQKAQLVSPSLDRLP